MGYRGFTFLCWLIDGLYLVFVWIFPIIWTKRIYQG